MKTAAILITLVLLVFAIALVLEARKAAKRDLKPFQPLPKSPSDKDASTLERQRRDSEIESEWRRNVEKNIAEREDRKQLSALLRKQAE